jgi:hypothetical protein
MRPPDAPDFPGGGRYRRLGPELERRFGGRCWRIVLDGGFGCPNRDGRLGSSGCAFCSLAAYGLSARPEPVPVQLARRLSARGEETRAIAYFQAGTATDAPLARLEELYGAALAEPRVVALAVGTRPDCLPGSVVELLAALATRFAKPVWLDLGLQVADDGLLASLGRGHGVREFEDAVERAHAAGLEVVAHVILDLPGAGERHLRATAACLNRLRVEGVKLHNLHVLAGTPLAGRLRAGEFRLGTAEEYARRAASFLTWLDPATTIHRLTGEAPAALMLAPAWATNKHLTIQLVESALQAAGTWQGGRLAPGRGPAAKATLDERPGR